MHTLHLLDIQDVKCDGIDPLLKKISIYPIVSSAKSKFSIGQIALSGMGMLFAVSTIEPIRINTGVYGDFL